ncbi:hypothetical protein KIPB_009077, partial [Kipferlia bialata]|eukprot:g9077.t1
MVKNLHELVKGVRAHKDDQEAFIQTSMGNIRAEIKDKKPDVRAIAVQKLTYLNLLGHDISFAAFDILSLMSSPKFHIKRVGYLACVFAFTNPQAALMSTSLFQKDIASTDVHEASVALSSLSSVATPDMARQLLPHVMPLMTSSKPYLRKRAIVCTYRLLLQYPEGLRDSLQHLAKRLGDDSSSVRMVTINVMTELVLKNPKNYVKLIPTFYDILKQSNNNWSLIKLVKMFAVLLPLEPRLSKKLEKPISNLVKTTVAKSLLFECIRTTVLGMPDKAELMRESVEKLSLFFGERADGTRDQNLKFLGLVILSKVLAVHPRIVAEQKPMIMDCLDDPDVTIRIQALGLVAGLVTRRNIKETVTRLMEHTKADASTKEDKKEEEKEKE